VWHEVDLRGLYIFERMVGFSVPVEGQIAIISYEGIHILDLRAPRIVRHDGAYPEGGNLYDQTQQVLSYGGKRFPILGECGGAPLMRNDRGETLLLTPMEDMLHVQDHTRHALRHPYLPTEPHLSPLLSSYFAPGDSFALSTPTVLNSRDDPPLDKGRWDATREA